jgi:hypothetical protein
MTSKLEINMIRSNGSISTMNNSYGHALILTLFSISCIGHISYISSYAISSTTTMDEINRIVNQLSPLLSKSQSITLSDILVSLDSQFEARGLYSQAILNMVSSQLHEDPNHSGVLSQSLILLSKYNVSNQTGVFRSAFGIADQLDHVSTQKNKLRGISLNNLIEAISTEALNHVVTPVTIKKINMIARTIDGLVDPHIPARVLNQIAISIGAHDGNITKSIYKIANVVNSEYNLYPSGPLVQSIRDLFPHYLYAYDNIINKIGSDAKGMEDDIDKIIIRDVAGLT